MQTRDETPQRLSSVSQGCRPRQREGEGSKPPTKPSNAAMRQTLCSDDSTAGAQLGPPSGRPEAPETMTIASAPPGHQGQRGPRTSSSEGDPGRVSQNRGVVAPSPPASKGPRAAALSSPDVAAAGCGSHLSGGRPPPPKSLLVLGLMELYKHVTEKSIVLPSLIPKPLCCPFLYTHMTITAMAILDFC